MDASVCRAFLPDISIGRSKVLPRRHPNVRVSFLSFLLPFFFQFLFIFTIIYYLWARRASDIEGCVSGIT